MFVFVRAVVYASFFIGFLLIYVPVRLLAWSGFVRPESIQAQQIVGMIIGAIGGLIALWCILVFITIGRGTPAPFDPPRRLVNHGPYRFVRNPMYIGATLALGSATLFYESLSLLGYMVVFFLVIHFFVVLYEEPTLRRTFGQEYESYCRQVKRWWPHV